MIARTACRFAEDLSEAMPRPPEEEVCDADGENTAKVNDGVSVSDGATTVGIVAGLTREVTRRLSAFQLMRCLLASGGGRGKEVTRRRVLPRQKIAELPVRM